MPLGRSKISISTKRKSFRGLPESLIMTDHSETNKSQISAFLDHFKILQNCRGKSRDSNNQFNTRYTTYIFGRPNELSWIK